MKIKVIYVDEMPKTCGDCMLCKYINEGWECAAIADEPRLAGTLEEMKYRRSDCPLKGVEELRELCEAQTDLIKELAGTIDPFVSGKAKIYLEREIQAITGTGNKGETK